MNFAHTHSFGLGWVLLILGFSLPWLVPIHSEPLPTIFNEILAAVAVTLLAAWLLLAFKSRFAFDALAVGFGVSAVIPLAQSATGLYLFSGEAPVVSFYLMGICSTMLIARRCEETAPGKLPDALFAALVMSSLISTALALGQWLQLDWGLFMAPIVDGTRAVANVGQANELSTLLVWGLVGLWWAYSHGRIGGSVCVLAAGFFLIGIASTQSRTGYLCVTMLFFTSQLAPSLIKNPKHKLGFVVLGCWFVILILGWGVLSKFVGAGEFRGVADQLSAGLRPQIWQMMIDGIAHRPWFGYGWNQGRLVQLYELPNYAGWNVGIQHAHNLILDLLVWNGIPLGLCLIIPLGYWFWWQFRKIKTADQFLLFIALNVFVLHSMLELPHCKAFFLVPAAIIMGVLNARTYLPVIFTIPRFVPLSATALMAGALVMSWIDYRKIEQDLFSYRMRMARIGSLVVPPPPNIYVLTALQSALVNLRIEPRSEMSTAELERMRITAIRYPIESALLNYAKAAALNNQPEEARLSLSRLCLLFSGTRCAQAREAWREFTSENATIPNSLFSKK